MDKQTAYFSRVPSTAVASTLYAKDFQEICSLRQMSKWL